MQRIVSSLFRLAACLLLAATVSAVRAEDKPVDPTGTWTWSMTGQNGQTRESTLKLKKEGDKITGTVSGRQNDTPIEDVKLTGNELSFKVVREFNGNKMTAKYNGKIDGDTIKGKVEATGRDGEARTRDWEAKRKKD
jgi:hypothetical protein